MKEVLFGASNEECFLELFDSFFDDEVDLIHEHQLSVISFELGFGKERMTKVEFVHTLVEYDEKHERACF